MTNQPRETRETPSQRGDDKTTHDLGDGRVVRTSLMPRTPRPAAKPTHMCDLAFGR